MREIVRTEIREHYGIEGTLSRLPGENLNYLVTANDGQCVIAKIAGPDMPSEVVEMEFAALEHAGKAQLGLDLPTIIKNLNGKIETRISVRNKIHNGEDKRLRLLHYVVGDNLSEISDISDNLRFDLGKSLARFDQAVADFDHPAAHRRHRWDLADAGQHQGKLALIDDLQRRELLAWAFAQFTAKIPPALAKLPWQFIHGDGNPENIRIGNGRVSGLLDFGDSCYNPTVCELAICLAYQMMDVPDPMEVAEQVIGGYESVRPLSAAERVVLLPLVCTRLAVSICVAAQRRTIDASNSNWFVTEAPAWSLLTWLRANVAH
jgi:Ser/Thr protein kinase RdoA (MazF antagonist)